MRCGSCTSRSLISKRSFNRLNKEQQAALTNAGKKSEEYFNKATKGLDDEMVATFKKNNVEVVTLTPAEYEAWVNGRPASWGTRPDGRPGRAGPSAARAAPRGAGGEPGRRRRGGGGEVDGDAVLVQQVDHLGEPVELVPALLRLQQRPGEDPDGDHGDAGLAHQPDVLGPGLAGPLLGVVVGPVGDPRQSCGQAVMAGTLGQLREKSTETNVESPALRPARGFGLRRRFPCSVRRTGRNESVTRVCPGDFGQTLDRDCGRGPLCAQC